jgi:rhodanese-related sulfurtransferase
MIFSVMKAFTRTLIALGFLVFSISCVAGRPSSEMLATGAAGTESSKSVGASAAGRSGDVASLPASLAYEDLARLLADEAANILLLDVRTKAEFDQGHIAGAVLNPYDALETMFKEQDKSRPIVLYCRTGNRSSTALRTLSRMGYTNVSDFGGINRWRGSLVKP